MTSSNLNKKEEEEEEEEEERIVGLEKKTKGKMASVSLR